MRTALLLALIAAGSVVAICCVVAPAIALAGALVSTDWTATGFGERRFTLLFRGLCVALFASALAALLGAGLAAGMTDTRRPAVRAVSSWAALVTFLTPPYIHAYAWSLTLLPGGVASGAPGSQWLPEWVLHEGRAVWCLATWLAPVAAVVLASGWLVAGRAAYRLALLDAGRWSALRRGALPVMTPWVGLALLMSSLLAMTEFSVCHLCQVQTLNTEILAELQISPQSALVLAWPLLLILAVIVALLGLGRRRIAELLAAAGGLRSAEDETGAASARGGLRIALTAAAATALLLPWGLLAARIGDPAALVTWWNTFPRDWPYGLQQAALAAGGAAVLAVSVDAALVFAAFSRRAGVETLLRAVCGVIGALLIATAIAPPALVGLAFLRAFDGFPPVSDHVWIVSATNVARFGALALVALRLASRSQDVELIRAARSDGAGWAAAYWNIRLPHCRGALLGAGTAVGLLALTEVAASTMVNPPGVPSLALTLLNQVHFGRNDAVIGLCLSLFAVVGVACIGLLWLRRR